MAGNKRLKIKRWINTNNSAAIDLITIPTKQINVCAFVYSLASLFPMLVISCIVFSMRELLMSLLYDLANMWDSLLTKLARENKCDEDVLFDWHWMLCAPILPVYCTRHRPTDRLINKRNTPRATMRYLSVHSHLIDGMRTIHFLFCHVFLHFLPHNFVCEHFFKSN